MGFVCFCVLEVAVVCVWCSSGGDRGDASFFFFLVVATVCVVMGWWLFGWISMCWENLDPD